MKFEKQLTDIQAELVGEQQAKLKLQLDLENKETELEACLIKLSALTSDSISVHSGGGGDTPDFGSSANGDYDASTLIQPVEGWVLVPGKGHGAKKRGWQRQYLVIMSKNMVFYENKEKQNVIRVLDLE